MSEIIEIVAAKINGSTITNSLRDIVEAAKQDRVSDYFDRRHMQFMAGCDLGSNWEALAKSKTLFYLVDGEPMFELPKEDRPAYEERK